MATTTDNSSSANPPVSSDKQKVNQWLEQYYLEYLLEDDGEAKVTMQDFINLVHLEFPECWFNEQQMSLALALSTKKHMRTDTLVLSDASAQVLFALGIGSFQAKDMTVHPVIAKSILDENKRWIVVPCSDGMLHFGDLARGWKKDHDDKARGEEGDRPEEASTDTAAVVVEEVHKEDKDKKEKEVKERKKKKEEDMKRHKRNAHISKTRPNEHGLHWGMLMVDKQNRIAHWIDSLVTLKRVGTKLKIHTMHRAGEAAGKVLCGIDSILSTQEGFEKGKFSASTLKYTPQQGRHNTTVEDGGSCGPFMFAFLEHLYSNPGKMDAMKMSFPRSRKETLRFNSMNGRREIRRLIQQEVESRASIPFKLTQELLHILDLVPVDYMVQKVQKLQDYIASLPPPKKPGNSKNNNKDDENDPRLMPYRVGYLKAQKDGSCASSGIRSLSEYAAQVEFTKDLLEAAKPKTKVVINSITYLIPNSDTKAWKPEIKAQMNWPKGTKALPDFANLTKAALDKWLQVNDDVSNYHEGIISHNTTTIKAMLHMKFKQTFITESAANLRDEWVHDSTVFPSEATKPEAASKIRYMLMQHYEPNTLEYIKKYADKKRPHDYSAQGGTAPKKTKSEGKSIWVTCSDQVLQTHLTEDITADPRATGQDFMTYRALLFVKDGGDFADEDAKTCLNFWINVPEVFTEGRDFTVKNGKRQCVIRVADVKKKMDARFGAVEPDEKDDDF